jgi:hypothetical protein
MNTRRIATAIAAALLALTAVAATAPAEARDTGWTRTTN